MTVVQFVSLKIRVGETGWGRGQVFKTAQGHLDKVLDFGLCSALRHKAVRLWGNRWELSSIANPSAYYFLPPGCYQWSARDCVQYKWVQICKGKSIPEIKRLYCLRLSSLAKKKKKKKQVLRITIFNVYDLELFILASCDVLQVWRALACYLLDRETS